MFRIVRVQYTTKAEYVPKNRENINRVMNDLQAINDPGIRYSTYMLDDGKTFMHFTHFATETAYKKLMELASFLQFQAELKASGPEVPPKTEHLSLVGASYDIF